MAASSLLRRAARTAAWLPFAALLHDQVCGVAASGLADAVRRLEGVEGIAMSRFTAADVVRHPIVGRIVDAYEGPNA